MNNHLAEKDRKINDLNSKLNDSQKFDVDKNLLQSLITQNNSIKENEKTLRQQLINKDTQIKSLSNKISYLQKQPKDFYDKYIEENNKLIALSNVKIDLQNQIKELSNENLTLNNKCKDLQTQLNSIAYEFEKYKESSHQGNVISRFFKKLFHHK